MRAGATALGLVLALMAAPAATASSIFPVGVQPVRSGPVFAGERVAWVSDRVDSGYDLTVAGADGSAPSITRVDARTTGTVRWISRSVALAASAERMALRAGLSECVDLYACKYMSYRTLYSAVLSAPLGESPEPLAGCTDGKCYLCGERGEPDLDGHVLAYADPCGSNVAVVRDLAPGGPGTEMRFRNAMRPRLAGDFVAVQPRRSGGGPAAIEVLDWRSGERRLRVEGLEPSLPAYDVQADGTLAFSRPGGGLEVASPSAPAPRALGVARTRTVRIAGGRVAYTRSKARDTKVEIGVVGLDGGRLAQHVFARGAAGWDFDGRRLVWLERPCAVAMVVVWDLASRPPAPPPGDCPYVSLDERRPTAALAERKLPLRLSCPAEPHLGCLASAWVTARRRGDRGRSELASGEVRLEPGESQVVQLRLAFARTCRVADGRDSIGALVHLRVPRRDEGDSDDVVKRVRVSGLEGCAR